MNLMCRCTVALLLINTGTGDKQHLCIVGDLSEGCHPEHVEGCATAQIANYVLAGSAWHEGDIIFLSARDYERLKIEGRLHRP